MYILLEMTDNKNTPAISGLVQQGRQLGICHAPGFSLFCKLVKRGKFGYVQAVMFFTYLIPHDLKISSTMLSENY